MDENYQKTCQLEMKGEGCREFERRNSSKTWLDLIQYMIGLNAKFKRIDIAVDDYEGKYVSLQWIFEEHYTSVFRTFPLPIGPINEIQTIQFGTHHSNKMIVIYDKRKEQMNKKHFCEKAYWVQYEMRFRNEVATAIIKKLLSTYIDVSIPIYGLNIKQYAYELLYGILDIKVDNHFNKSNQNKADSDSLWKSFLNHVPKVPLPKIEKKPIKPFAEYEKIATPYASAYLLYKFVEVNEDTYLFQIELLKTIRDNLPFSKFRLKRLNVYLKELNLAPVDNNKLEQLKVNLSHKIEEKILLYSQLNQIKKKE
ncbi:MAG: replication initiation factor domain-containing protein [Ureaplasma sp.]|nr:replication initiation factor domain-containing protein [Ureaplasma sp.]MDE7221777.1 replication initiation factor domain-containing protein [Ureaplasma sp.]